MEIQSIRHSWPERAGFTLRRKQGAEEYVLLHFHTPVELYFGHQTHIVAGGTVIVFAPHTPHEFFSPGPLLHDWMHIVGNFDAEMSRFGLAPDTLYSCGCGQRISEIVSLMEGEFFAQRDFWQDMIQARLRELLILLRRDLLGSLPPPVPLETAEKLRALRGEMLMHPERPWTSDSMARRINLSASRLYPLYRRIFSVSPNRDLILMRIEKARNMLRQGESVSRVAEQMGYASPQHFVRQFKQITGISPGQYAHCGENPPERSFFEHQP
ncbi:MAG: AraC family transcriptional regulator [Eubacteriales bacterium]|nr:AraC family transcriptional regulator [Eubacteriales bacterium]